MHPRSISITSIKRVSRVNVSATRKSGKTVEGTDSTNEMDSHADTCVAGKNWGVLSYTDVVCEVSRGRDGRTGYEEVFGQTPNIAEYVDFEFYDLVWWWDKADKMSSTTDPKRLARWLGISHRVGGDNHLVL